MKLINVGYGNLINANKVVAVVAAGSAPSKRAIQEARKCMLLVDATEGKKTETIIITESGHVITSHVKAETIMKRGD